MSCESRENFIKVLFGTRMMKIFGNKIKLHSSVFPRNSIVLKGLIQFDGFFWEIVAKEAIFVIVKKEL